MLAATRFEPSPNPLNASDSSDELLLEHEPHARGGVYRLILNRPERLNVLGTRMLEALEAALARIRDDDDARVVILASSGARAWIGGADIREMADLDCASARTFITRLHGVCAALRALPVPVIARIEGFCLGGGLEVAACCDLRIACEGSRFGMPEVQVGVPSVIEAALLPRLIGAGRSRDLVLTGRVIEAGEALAWGLVDTVVARAELDAAVDERLKMILDAGPAAIRAQKALCHQWETLPLDAAIEAGIDAFEKSFEGDEARRYMRRFLERPRKRSNGKGN